MADVMASFRVGKTSVRCRKVRKGNAQGDLENEHDFNVLCAPYSIICNQKGIEQNRMAGLSWAVICVSFNVMTTVSPESLWWQCLIKAGLAVW
ncbi:hypothetical protein VFPPC_18765 [Pochonia chlamydosporia 170]|uniref:Uncharacterized protein n=1 Tax=Pochonia chlamydosporia 170 TaxID=1380566 RepID=A0A219ARW0_METCM|nr:hypothetical protein VFPPC_18765 [Pochonia chlamydosporia 170]OWT43508.1 hypothetical protein VFPPC_18765 [Pochonia chlamydosporia 170]